MELFNKDISKLSNTEINLVIHKIKENYDMVKNQIIESTTQLEEIENKINSDLELLKKYENFYIEIVNELIKRE